MYNFSMPGHTWDMDSEKKTKTAKRETQKPAAEAREHLASSRRAAIVVGGSSGIGRETALRLLSRGYRVYNVSRTPFKGERVQTIKADAAREGELERAIRAAGEEATAIDLLVYSAGFSMAAPALFETAGRQGHSRRFARGRSPYSLR